MLVIQRPTVEAVGEARGQPPAVRRRPARARLRPHPRQLAAPHPAVVDPRRGRSRRCASTTPSTSSTPSPASPRTSPTSSSTSRTSCSRRTSDEPVTLRLDVRGPADVTAGDIQRPADVEILNPDLHIATLNAKGRLAIDLTVEQGRGYLSADRNNAAPHDRRDPGRRDLLAGAPGDVRRSSPPASSSRPTTTASSSTSRPTARSRPREALASAGATLRSLVEPRRRR